MIFKTMKTFFGRYARAEWVERGLFWAQDRKFLTIIRTDYWTEDYIDLGYGEIVKIVYLHERVEELHILRRVYE